MADEPIAPLAYGLLDVGKLKLVFPTAYAGEETAKAAAVRLTNQWRTVVAVPLFGPDTYAVLQAQLQAARTGETSLRNENIHLHNQLAERRGKAVAEAHAAGRPASEADHG